MKSHVFPLPQLSRLRKYIAFFRLRFTMGLQYRTAAFAGIVTQFIWGIMEILMFRAFLPDSLCRFVRRRIGPDCRRIRRFPYDL